jgi:hypothetical protein
MHRNRFPLMRAGRPVSAAKGRMIGNSWFLNQRYWTADNRRAHCSCAVACNGCCALMSAPELTLPSGRRADLVALSSDGRIDIIEIKSSVADFRTDEKWPDYRRHCDRLFFAIPPQVPVTIIPIDVGLIVADCYGAEVLRDPAEHRIVAATRRAVLLRFAQIAAQRLHDLHDPHATALSG